MKTILTMVLSAMTVAAFAQEATPDTWMGQARSTAASSDVRSEAKQLLASGELARLDSPGYLPTVSRPRLRAEADAELHAARVNGELAILSAEAHDFATVPDTTSYAYRQLLVGRR